MPQNVDIDYSPLKGDFLLRLGPLPRAAPAYTSESDVNPFNELKVS